MMPPSPYPPARANAFELQQKWIVYFVMWYHIVSHFVVFLSDYTQVIPLIDFVTRPDGSASDPLHLEPLELIYAGITGMAFGTIAMAYLLAWFDNSDSRNNSIRGAAALSAWFHLLWNVHMLWRWDAWRSMMHPKGGMTPEFFLVGNTVWTLSSLAVVVMLSPSVANKKQQDKSN
jgi:hypothetical protein